MLLQALIAAVVLFLAPQIIDHLGGKFIQLGMFRLGVLGAYFHVLFLFICVVFSYFDLRKISLYLFTLFFVLNGLGINECQGMPFLVAIYLLDALKDIGLGLFPHAGQFLEPAFGCRIL